MLKNLRKKYNLSVMLFLILTPLVSVTVLPVYIYYSGVVWQEPMLLVVGWLLAGTGITVGYHRYFSHRTFKTFPLVEWVLMLLGTMGLENTIVKWCSDHRRHHRKLDTDDDPYSITKGFFHAHIGWIVKKDEYRVSGVSDLQSKPAVVFQEKYYLYMAVFASFILPTLIGALYDRPLGGLLWGGVLRITLVHHFTYFINSLCHFVGKKNYDINTTARDSWLVSWLTFGEGYHNYHHKFQWDYRNGITWYSFDPSKWIIRILSFFKITHNLRRAPEYSVFQARVDTINQRMKALSEKIKSNEK